MFVVLSHAVLCSGSPRKFLTINKDRILWGWLPKTYAVGLWENNSETPISHNFLIFSLGCYKGFPDGSAGKESACNAGDTRDTGLILGSGRSPKEGNGNALQYSCLENPTDREAWQSTIQRSQRVGHNWATKRTIDYYIMQVFNIFHWLQIHFHWESLTSSLVSWIFLPFSSPPPTFPSVREESYLELRRMTKAMTQITHPP